MNDVFSFMACHIQYGFDKVGKRKNRTSSHCARYSSTSSGMMCLLC